LFVGVCVCFGLIFWFRVFARARRLLARIPWEPPPNISGYRCTNETRRKKKETKRRGLRLLTRLHRRREARHGRRTLELRKGIWAKIRSARRQLGERLREICPARSGDKRADCLTTPRRAWLGKIFLWAFFVRWYFFSCCVFVFSFFLTAFGSGTAIPYGPGRRFSAAAGSWCGDG